MTLTRILIWTCIGAPIITYAQATGLVPCSGADCQACDVLKLVQNLINALITLATTLAIIGLTWNGFKMVTSGSDNPMMHQVFKQKLKNIVIGFLLMLGAWVIVDTVMKLFLNEQQFGSWNKIECVAQPVPTAGQKATVPNGGLSNGGTGTSPVVSTSTTPTVITGAAIETISGSVGGRAYSCVDCGNLRTSGLTCKEAQCYTEQGTRASLLLLNGSYPLRITEAMPPTVVHSNACHYNGTCVDATVSSVTNAAQAIEFSKTASSKGIRAVWEGESCTTRNEIRAAGGEAWCKSDSGYGHITGTHYSLYKK